MAPVDTPAAVASLPAPVLAPEDEVPVRTVPEGGARSQLATVYAEVPVSDVEFPSQTFSAVSYLSVAEGAFCFLNDAGCRSSLLLSADVAAGLNVLTGRAGASELPFTQYRVGGGFVLRPLYLATGNWHPWGLGAKGNWSRGSGFAPQGAVPAANDPRRLGHTDAVRLLAVSQLWLQNRPNALHLDLALGAVKSRVRDYPGTYWGSHLEFAFGFGGWGALFIGGDFLDRDLRMLVGFRAHGILAGPVAGLGLLGSVAGGQQ